MTLSITPDPVGTPNQDAVQLYITALEVQWATEAATNPTASWWQFWKQPIVVHQATLFMLQCLDYVVVQLDKAIMANQDKKATALSALSTMYDLVIAPVIPIYAKPFASFIKSYFINVFVSNMIDFLCAKYHSSVWPLPPTPPAPPVPSGT